MAIAPDGTRAPSSPEYRAMREAAERLGDELPGEFEITGEGIVHDMRSPAGPHELTALRVRKRLERQMPEELVAHTGTPDV
jgi:hypothetical protein